MADTTEEDSTALYLGLMASALMCLMAGLVIHLFIIGVNVTDWWKGRSLTPVDHIVTSLEITRMCSQCADTLYFLVKLSSSSILDLHSLSLIISFIYTIFTHANIWLTSLLSIVLCLKISNLHTRLFLYLRRMILHRTVYLILSSLLLSTLNCFMYLLIFTKVSSQGTYNTSMDKSSKDCTDINYLSYFAIGAFFPVLFYYISSILLFTFLYHHTTRMRMSSNLSINLETYYSVMKFVSLTCMYITMKFTGQFVSTFYYFVYCVALPWFYIVFDFLTTLHSSYLIYRTAKLRTQMSEVFHNAIGFLLQRKHTETREDIEMTAQGEGASHVNVQ